MHTVCKYRLQWHLSVWFIVEILTAVHTYNRGEPEQEFITGGLSEPHTSETALQRCVFLSVCLSICLSVRPSVCLSVCLFAVWMLRYSNLRVTVKRFVTTCCQSEELLATWTYTQAWTKLNFWSAVCPPCTPCVSTVYSDICLSQLVVEITWANNILTAD